MDQERVRVRRVGVLVEAVQQPHVREVLEPFERVAGVGAAAHAHSQGLRVNAGHGLNYDNLPDLHAVPHLEELNIGHSIVSRAMSIGLPKAVKEMLSLMKGYRG